MAGIMNSIDLLPNIVKKMLWSFVDMTTSKALPRKRKHNHIDITLSKEGSEFYTIQITKYGTCSNNILQLSNKVFGDLIVHDLVPKYTSLATVYSKRRYEECAVAYDLRFAKKCLSLSKNTTDKEFNGFSLWREYLSFEFKHKLVLSESEEFQDIILSEFNSLQEKNPYTKFTYQQDEKMIYNNHVPLDEDYKSCGALSVALTDVVKQSLNFEFTDNCLAIMEVDNPNQLETALMVKLLPMINENYGFHDEEK